MGFRKNILHHEGIVVRLDEIVVVLMVVIVMSSHPLMDDYRELRNSLVKLGCWVGVGGMRGLQ